MRTEERRGMMRGEDEEKRIQIESDQGKNKPTEVSDGLTQMMGRGGEERRDRRAERGCGE